uniref:Superoxide dismutase [Cu-Zn] n=1 Tax=Oncorhynchus kisutch TaxID=8019 RepID=A0A8C7KAE4_ONCKI
MVLKAVCVLTGTGDVTGTVFFEQEGEDAPVKLTGEIAGLAPGAHGFHVHAFGDNTNGCTSAGPHFNPHNKTHGGPNDDLHVVSTRQEMEGNAQRSPSQHNFVLFRAIHEKADDLGKGGNEESLKTGNAGGRQACGVIGITQ